MFGLGFLKHLAALRKVEVILPMVKAAVLTAERSFADNAQRREWVVAMLMQHGVPETIARLALELALAQTAKS